MGADLSKSKLRILREMRGMAIPFVITDQGVPFNLPEENPTDDQIRLAVEGEMSDVYLSQEGDQWGRRDLGTNVEALLEENGTADIVDRIAMSVLVETQEELPHLSVMVTPRTFNPMKPTARLRVLWRLSDRQSSGMSESTIGSPPSAQEA